MDNKTHTFRNHIFGKVYQYILTHDYFNAYMQTEEGENHDTDEFYATAIPELLRSLKDNFELDKNYREVVGSLPTEERPAIQKFMAWFNIHQDDTFREVYAAQAYDQSYDFNPIFELMELTKTRVFDPQVSLQNEDDALENIFKVIDHFTTACGSVLLRRKNKPVLKLLDEYDMQDLLLIMLRAYFPSVKTEQVIDGNVDRHFLKIDFLMPDSKIAIECKFFEGGYMKKLTDELDIDIQSYHHHPDCRYLIFFIYDIGLLINDANGLERKYDQIQTFGEKKMNIFLKVRPKN